MFPSPRSASPASASLSRRLRTVAVACVLWTAAAAAVAAAAHDVRVGSKRFTESYILGEIVQQTLVAEGVGATHRAGLGNTGILVAALDAGEIDVYPEYTGTIVREILKRDGNPSLDELNATARAAPAQGRVPLGFSNTYALAMRDDEAARRGIMRIWT